MLAGRRIWLVLAVSCGLAGCRAADTGSLSSRARPGIGQKSFDLDEFVAQHNRNAESIETLEARPSIDVTSGRKVAVDGRLAIERPRNFKLELSSFGIKKGDIGSNDEEFWYWVAMREQPYVFWCRYDEVQSSALPITYQPDWIIEALGLRVISREDAARVQVRPGIEPGTSVLTFPPVRDQGEPYSREMVVLNRERRIKKLMVFSEKPRTLIAEATPTAYQSLSTSGGAATPGTCYLPTNLKLDWKREQLVLDVAMNPKEIRLNQFDHTRSAALFVEPQIPGYTRRNLAEASRGMRPERRTSTRETLPAPDMRGSIELGEPTPVPDDATASPRVGSRSRRSAPASASSDPASYTFGELVGAPTPRGADYQPTPPQTFSFAPGADMAVER